MSTPADRRRSILPTRRTSIHFTPSTNPRPRWLLHLQANMWRFLMSIGMLFHRLAPPRPPKPSFTRSIPSTLSGTPGTIPLQFYVPADWETQRGLWEHRPRLRGEMKYRDVVVVPPESEEGEDGGGGKSSVQRRVSSGLDSMGRSFRRRSMNVRRWGNYPVVINFHGGGFTLGTATDDARWCGTVVDELNAVVISVDYRLAPEFPFPTAVEDGADVVLWVYEHHDELGIDREKIALSGFSSGANMAFTVPLRLYDEHTGFRGEEEAAKVDADLHGSPSTVDSTRPSSSSSTKVASFPSTPHHPVSPADPDSSPTPPENPPSAHPPIPTPRTPTRPIPTIPLRCLIAWYPSLDYTLTRTERRATLPPSISAAHSLPPLFTDLFDESYLHPSSAIPLDSPYLSPGVAPSALLRGALPRDIVMATCEYDMLLEEGEAFRQRLEGLGKRVRYTMVEGARHGWDKGPNPLRPTKGVREQYLRACREMRGVMGEGGGRERERRTGMAVPGAASRGGGGGVR
ncbi:hypothetical protein LTR91_009300 [Friedmanniomyces endolithicus]|uniref:Alpha/beta hydrolase fold-3 domain-containing protein n=1 Tax=Friedmanniomyces endolithicus TaxID=329885 RepID=A0AAN6QU50_9PEZI|nr:hypothetical protein LTR87_017448 [Friedmanniomyces endolithicus]KAK0955950.1 hypothetical protein LTS01_023095 [Friedmanniomyces endolithicus]KAK0989294.1 hypothetical protein LTR91_009300 [Friedmanniomyces endolithicus]KAK1050490.1 hypothetical protein LTS16_002987 [Friedmanniomyces endolithicus]